MGAREDDDYWNTKYAEAECYEHGADEMVYDTEAGEWVCRDCEDHDELNRIYKYG